MSKRIGNTAVIRAEPARKCELCGAVEETRPYGPDGKRICFKCAMKDEAGSKRRMAKVLFGDEIDN